MSVKSPILPAQFNALVPNPQTQSVGEEILEGGSQFRYLLAQFYSWMFSTGVDVNGNVIAVPSIAFETMICEMNCGQPTTPGTGPTSSSSTSTRSTTSSTSSTSTSTLQSLGINWQPTINRNGPANTVPYPSTRYYPNVVAPVNTLTLNIVGLSSPTGAGIWIILENPAGSAVLVMAGNAPQGQVIGDSGSTQANFTITTAFYPIRMPCANSEVTNIYSSNQVNPCQPGLGPNNPIINLPSPAPQSGPYGWGVTTPAEMLALATAGTQGTWSLWVCGLTQACSGSIVDWSLTIS